MITARKRYAIIAASFVSCFFGIGIVVAPSHLDRIVDRTEARFSNGMSMWLPQEDEQRLKSWHPGDRIRLCKVGMDSPWACDSDGNCTNLLMITFRIKAQNITRNECPVTWQANKQAPCARLMPGSDH